MKKYLIIVIVSLYPLFAISQKAELKKAENQFREQKYFEAIKSYTNIFKKGTETPEVIEKLAQANYFNANYEQANVWYSKLVMLGQVMNGEDYYRYAQTLKSVGKTDEALIQLEIFKKSNPTEIRTHLINKTSNEESRFEFSNIKSISINTQFSDYGPAINGNKLIFSSAKNAFLNNITNERTNQSFTSLFQSSKSPDGNYSKPKLFSKGSFSIYNEATPVFSKDGKTMYYTQNQFVKKSNTKLVNGSYKLYKSIFVKNKWINKGSVTFGQNDSIRIAHPALSPDGKFLYFVSDNLTKNGESDLFKVGINEDGTFNQVDNLGEKINTEGRDSYPFITENNTLIFASDGRSGKGGFDLYSIDLSDTNAQIISLGEVINSPYDDFAMVLNSDMTNGYYTSNKPGGKGDDDIYSFDLLIKKIVLISIKGTVVDEETNEIQPNAILNLLDNEKVLIASIKSDSNGIFLFKDLKPNTSYLISVSKFDYQENSVSFVTKEVDFEKLIPIKKVELQFKSVDDLNEILKLHKIYFDLGKYTLREESKIVLDKVVEFLNKYKTINIEVGSHSDSRQSAVLNQKLSQNRAVATFNYLTSKGIETNRLTLKGYGETKLINSCSDNVKCSEEEHQQNRRSTFIIINVK
ncbi:OmpA family protein [uncultured Flavobacterium sp.]|uniref:OmpA family protein n=1 Tax=uncultured Flavobacterium sp. TaxID=165435 RepID=UPI0030CA49B6